MAPFYPGETGSESKRWWHSNQFRILYFFQMSDEIVLVHALSKKTQQLKEKNIDLVEKRMEESIRRFPAGGEIWKKGKFGHSKAGWVKTSKIPNLKRITKKRESLKQAMKIVELREKKGLSQQQLAELMGTSQQAISRIESGEYEGFTLNALEKIAAATVMTIKIDFVAA